MTDARPPGEDLRTRLTVVTTNLFLARRRLDRAERGEPLAWGELARLLQEALDEAEHLVEITRPPPRVTALQPP